MDEKSPEISHSGVTILRAFYYSALQLQILKKSNTLVIDGPPEYAYPYLTKLVAVCAKDTARVLANLLSISSKHITTFTEFCYELNPGGELRTTSVETHIFVVRANEFDWNEDNEIW